MSKQQNARTGIYSRWRVIFCRIRPARSAGHRHGREADRTCLDQRRCGTRTAPRRVASQTLSRCQLVKRPQPVEEVFDDLQRSFTNELVRPEAVDFISGEAEVAIS